MIAQLASPAVMIATVFMVIISFLMTLGVRKIADAVLGESSGPWYLRDGGGLFALVAALVGGVLTCLLGISALAAAAQHVSPLTLALESVAFMLIWFLRLDWPASTREAADEEDDEDQDDDDEADVAGKRRLFRRSPFRSLFHGLFRG
jgi:membrane protein implicated in regulation of membrane protease activity